MSELIQCLTHRLHVIAQNTQKVHIDTVAVQRYELYFILDGKMRLFIQHGVELIFNQLSCLYRHLGANSDGATLVS